MSRELKKELWPAPPTVYLAGKVRGSKWELVKGLEETAIFISSDGSTHGEHLWGYWESRYGELKSDVAESCINLLEGCDFLVAYLDSPDSFGSIAEIAYASAIGKRCYLLILDPQHDTPEAESGPMQFPAFFDSYWFISNFPNVTTEVVPSFDEAYFTLMRLVETAAIEALLTDFAQTLESPLEEKFFHALLNFIERIEPGSGGGPVLRALSKGVLYHVHNQYPVSLHRNYRLDFLFETETLKVAVEIDGHEFHERTKEQAQRDKERDRALAAAGYTVLRFTGSEVYRDPNKCVGEVLALLGVRDS